VPAQPLRVLLVEDDEDDFVITSNLLSEIPGRQVDLKWVATYPDALREIESGQHDICLVDYSLGERNGLELLHEAVEVNCVAPMIMLTGHTGYDIDTQAMKAGAADYLVKAQINTPLLERSIRHALQRSEIIENLRKLASHDELTGLHNRRAMDSLLQEVTERHQRYDRPAALVMLDVDHFKGINDSYGHLVGDEVLRWLGQLLRETVRSVDLLARYGGEELAIILPEMNSRQAVGMAERVRRRVGIRPFVFYQNDGQRVEIPITISLGVAEMPDDARTGEALIAAADQALYAAKRRGRNCSVEFRDLADHSKTN